MRAVVTGGSGFVGGWLSEHLRAAGDEVISVDHEVDVTEATAVSDLFVQSAPGAVYHLAAMTHVGDSWSDPHKVFEVNALGTLNVLQAARACAPRPRVLVTSSAEIYGTVSEKELPITESTALAPVTPYGASKVAAEFLAVQAFLGYGLEVIRVRPFNHVGPGQGPSFVVAALASHIVEASRSGSKQVPVGNLSPRRDLTDVRDVVRAYRMLIERGEAGEVYNVCSGRDVSIEEIARTLLDLAGVQLELVVDPDLVRSVDVPVVRGDPSKLREATGWRTEIELSDTLRDILDDWNAKAA